MWIYNYCAEINFLQQITVSRCIRSVSNASHSLQLARVVAYPDAVRAGLDLGTGFLAGRLFINMDKPRALRSDSDMIHNNTAVINLTYLGLWHLMGLFPESLGGLRGLSVLAVGGQKQLEKSANHFINAHCSRAKQQQQQQRRQHRPPQLPHVATCPTCNFVAQGFIWEAAHHLA